MIKFFREIRQKLLVHNRVSKYLLYVIGEILLVAVGILLALQVNNWNEQQKRGNEEIIILKEIAQNLEADLKDFKNNFTHFRNAQIASENLINAIENDVSNHDSLAFHLFFSGLIPYLSPNLSGYKLLESKGLEIISNDSLRKALTQFYDVGYPWLLTRERDNRVYVWENLHKLRNKYLGTVSIFKESQPNSLDENVMFNLIILSGSIRKLINYKDFNKDTELLSAIKDAGVRSKLESEFHRWYETIVKDLITLIEMELQND